ncbi:MAG: V-type ATPase subunit [Candidatus Margulisiibacteriota bacterium]
MVKLAYAIGRIRSMEAYLIGDLSLAMMIDSKDFESSFSVLSENRSYAETISRLESPFDFSGLLDMETSKTLAILEELCPFEPAIDAMKQKFVRSIAVADYSKLLHKTAAGSESRVFKRYAAAYSFFSGIKAALMNSTRDPENILSETRYSDYGAAVVRGIENYKKTGSLSELEKEEDDFLIETVRPAKYKSFGIDPAIGFFVARETEIKNLRMIFTAKQLNTPVEDIKRSVRLSYV